MKNNTAAILLSIFGFFLFSIGDIARKYLLQDYTPIEIQSWATIYSVITMLIFSPLLGGVKSLKTITKPHIHIFKAICINAVMLCAIFGIQRLQLDLFYALVFTIPFITSIMAAIFYKEPLTLKKTALIALGFVGVLIIARPSSDADFVGVIICLTLAVFFALNSVLNKNFSPTEPKFPMGFIPYCLCALTFFILAKGQLAAMPLDSMLICAMAGCVSVLAMVVHIYAFQKAAANVIAPYQYTQLVWGVLFGYLLFHHVPDFWNAVGGGIIVLSGLLLFLSEQKKSRS